MHDNHIALITGDKDQADRVTALAKGKQGAEHRLAHAEALALAHAKQDERLLGPGIHEARRGGFNAQRGGLVCGSSRQDSFYGCWRLRYLRWPPSGPPRFSIEP